MDGSLNSNNLLWKICNGTRRIFTSSYNRMIVRFPSDISVRNTGYYAWYNPFARGHYATTPGKRHDLHRLAWLPLFAPDLDGAGCVCPFHLPQHVAAPAADVPPQGELGLSLGSSLSFSSLPSMRFRSLVSPMERPATQPMIPAEPSCPDLQGTFPGHPVLGTIRTTPNVSGTLKSKTTTA